MIDREKVIKGLEICSAGEWNSTVGRDHTDCPYYPAGYTGCTCKLLMRDALALLQVQDQSNKPREERHEVTINHVLGDDVEVWSEFYCPHCGAMIAKGNSEHYPRCMWCGGKIQWV